MNCSDEDISILAELGLTVSQAKIYLSLAKAKNLTAQAISTISKVSRPDVYRILAQLQEAGLTEKIIAKPIEFYGIPINECVSTLMERRIQKTTELAHKAKSLTQNFKRNVGEQNDEKLHFILLPKKPSIHAKAEKMLCNAQDCICFLMEPRTIFPWLSTYLPIFEEALARKVDCRLITPQFETNHYLELLNTLMKYSNFDLRLISGVPKAIFGVWDRKAALINTSPVGTQGQTPTLWSNNKSVVDLCSDYFEYLWINAKRTNLKKMAPNSFREVQT